MSTVVSAAVAGASRVAGQLLTDDGWKWRRRVLFSTLGFFAITLSFIVWRGADTALDQQIAVAMIGSGTALVTGYVLGAVWDDKNKRMHAFGAGDRGFDLPDRERGPCEADEAPEHP